ncbi:conserved protein of unknown function [Cupriavidus taiwanensis]|nr:conserved protein of unknown function [Cupriavidus taiwanensis]
MILPVRLQEVLDGFKVRLTYTGAPPVECPLLDLRLASLPGCKQRAD